MFVNRLCQVYRTNPRLYWIDVSSLIVLFEKLELTVSCVVSSYGTLDVEAGRQ